MSLRPERDEKLRSGEIEAPPEASREDSLKRYEPPRVECYGRLHEVTQMGGSLVVDTGFNLGNPP